MLTDSRGLIEASIKEWIRRNVCTFDKERGRCSKLVVRHLTIDKKPDADVHTVNIPGDPSVEGTEVADRVILDVAESAQRDANDLGGLQTYAVYAYYSIDKTYVPRKIFRVSAEDEIEREREGTTEPATEKGLLSQLMRHNENNNRNSLVAMGYILQTFQKELKESREQNKVFMNQQIDMTLLVQEVLDGAAKRRLEEKQAEIQVSVIEGVFEHLKVGLPVLINRLAGKEIFPAKMDRELYMMATLFEGLAPEQQAELTSMLRPEQLSVLAELLGMYEERKHKFLKQHGEEPPEPDDDGKKKNGSSNGLTKRNGSPKEIGKGSFTLLKLFERRKNLVNGEKAAEVDDERSKRIERRALDIKNRLKDAKSAIRGDDDSK